MQASLDNLANFGYTTATLNKVQTEELSTLINRINWVPDPDGTYKRVPDWVALVDFSKYQQLDIVTRELLIAEELMSLVPKDLIDFVNSVLSDKTLIPFDHHLVAGGIDIWDGTESTLSWHADKTPFNSNISLLIYIDNGTYTSGGELTVGVRVGEQVVTLATIKPISGTVAILQNSVDRFVHKPLPASDSQIRFTLNILCKNV